MPFIEIEVVTAFFTALLMNWFDQDAKVATYLYPLKEPPLDTRLFTEGFPRLCFSQIRKLLLWKKKKILRQSKITFQDVGNLWNQLFKERLSFHIILLEKTLNIRADYRTLKEY